MRQVTASHLNIIALCISVVSGAHSLSPYNLTARVNLILVELVVHRANRRASIVRGNVSKVIFLGSLHQVFVSYQDQVLFKLF